jgi:hypothetical protein
MQRTVRAIIAVVFRGFDFHKLPAISFVRHCKLSVDVVNIIDQNHAWAVLPTGMVPVVPVDEVAKLSSEPIWVLLRRAKCLPLPDSEHDSFFIVMFQRANVGT